MKSRQEPAERTKVGDCGVDRPTRYRRGCFDFESYPTVSDSGACGHLTTTTRLRWLHIFRESTAKRWLTGRTPGIACRPPSRPYKSSDISRLGGRVQGSSFVRVGECRKVADPGSTLEIRCQPPNCPDNLSKPVIHSAPLPSSATIIINVLRTYSPTPPTLRLMDGAETRLFSSCQRTPMNLMCSWQTRWPFRAGQDGAQKEEERVEQSLIKPIPLDHPCRGAPIDRIVTWICSADCLHLRTAVAVHRCSSSADKEHVGPKSSFPVDAKYPLSGLVSSTGIAPS